MLRAWLDRAGAAPPPFRLIRCDGRRAIVEVDHRSVGWVRAAWSTGPDDASEGVPPVTTYRTWGTLVGAKAWLRRSSSAVAAESRATAPLS